MILIDKTESIKIVESHKSKQNKKTNNKKSVFIVLNAQSLQTTMILKEWKK